VIGGKRIGRIHGARDQTYTSGVVCAKVARYWERIHHPDRLTQPLRRVGPKGSGQFKPIDWDEALDRVVDNFLSVEREFGPEGVWPYFYAGTMGLVMRDGIERLTHAKRYSRFHGTICVGIAWPGYVAGTGKLMGADPREMAKSDCVVIWGTNAVTTQVNVMTHAIRARKERGAKIVAIDIYETETMRQADLSLCVRPGTDGALACAVMHILFRDGFADWDYLERYTDAPHALEAHVRTRDPVWASAITGVSVSQIEEFAALVGRSKRSFFRLGYGFSRQRNGAANMHAALCIPAVTGAWAYEGGRLAQQQRRVQVAKDDDRGARCPRYKRPPSGPVPDRRDTDWRRGGAERRAAGACRADPEHEPARGGAESGESAPRFFAG
jgi:anaerobic selenocysteine-containing dehydrogenase